ncbi:hypothetical protein K490DRAFT_62767 [Saccharata proteae CBS 121410]|uniref:GET complex, subunit GET2 n=1 Tax=Saccharata proteae CBS 121410 TaxID=1314787 RepID=A0A9P4LYG9_9PEZI|nr:hypothetical protein K490DRAFT_62767 [Saccharata proteae CBS 121410]
MEESDAQRQARLRRERRAAKIQAGGASRLEAITSLSGRPAPAPEDAPPATQTPPAAATSKSPTAASSHAADDPDEVDISEHYYQPQSTPRLPASGPQSLNASGSSSPFPGTPAGPAAANDEDPMMRMLQQMMTGGGGGGGEAGPNGGADDPMMRMMQMMGSGGMGGGPQQQQQQGQPTSSAYVWRVIHAVFSVSLALYIALASTFNGSKLARSQSLVEGGGGVGQQLFWLFATAEVVLQSTRYFVEGGKVQGGGWLSMLGQVLPMPYAGYVRVVGRYSVIYTTVVADAMAVVFVLGAMAWWKGLAVS